LTPALLSRAEARVVAPACDRRGVWRGEAACEVFAAPGERATIQGEGAWRGPVYVLSDRGTASAAEDLVAWLQQNRVATVIGERSMGAGCGYVDGGTRTSLRASHFDVLMPNCARFLDDGSNEIEGLAPDVAIDMHAEEPAAKARALFAALDRGRGW
jgi:C-terminal processing protease CtpA/Prc